MDKPTKTAAHPDWLKEYSSQSSAEQMASTSMAVFHRLRVAELLLLRRHKIADLSGQELANAAREFTENENSLRQENIRDFDLKPTDHPEDAAWYLPYDTSAEVLADGVRWYQQLAAQTETLDLMSVGISNLIKDLYQAGHNKEWAAERLAHLPTQSEFSEFIAGMMSNKQFEVGNPQKQQLEPGTVQAVINTAGSKLADNQRILTQWIQSLAADINQLHQKSQLDNQPADQQP